MDARCFAWRISLALTALCLAACGGGGGGGGSALPPTSGSLGSVGAPPPSSGPAAVAFSIAVPSASTSSSARRARYVSAGTKSVAVSYAGNRQTADCTSTCTLTLAVNPGTVTFDVGLFDGPGGTGHALSSGTTTASIVSGQNAVKVSFAGVVAKVAVALGTSTVSAGSAAAVPVTVNAMDAAGYTIVGSDPYQAPIALSLDDTSGATALSTASVAAPGAAVTLTYNGSAAIAAVHVGANAGAGIAVQPATLTVQPAAAAPPPPSGSAGAAPVHVKTFAYYGINNMDADVPAAYMAAHVDMVIDDGFSAPHADAFKRAGGGIALAYTDPSYVPHCPPPFTAPAGTCQGPIGNLVANDESAFVHGANGERVRRYNDPYFQYQEVLNVGAVSAQNAYAQTANGILARSPRLDGFEADDSGSTFSGDSLGSNLFWGFNAPGVEFASDEQYISAESAMLKAAGKPVLINGGDPSTLGPAYNGRFLDQPNVLGAMFEGCFNNESGPYTDRNNLFLRETNGYLSALPHHKIALCSPTGDSSPARRLYAYAAFMLVYDPVYSYYGMVVNQSDNESLYPETELVPQQPAKTATTIDQLKSGGVYVRQFGSCSIAGSAIGPCAAVVNASSSASAAVPALSTSYAHAIALDPQSIYHGGKANVVAGAPTSLPPASAAILVR